MNGPILPRHPQFRHPQFRPHVLRSTRASRLGGGAALVILALLATMPWWAARSDMRLLTEFLYILALAQMWNLLSGFGGLLSVGQQAYIGIGGYMLVIAGLKLGLNPFLTIPLAGLAAMLIAVPTGAALFRLRGAHFAVGTWVFAEVFSILTANMGWVGGGSGLSITQTVRDIPLWWRDALTFWVAVVVGAGSVAAVYALLRSRWGLALTAVRDSEAASASLGVNVAVVKWAVYLGAAFGCGVIGALIFITKLRISPAAAYSVDWTAIMFFVVVIGGIGTIEGPIVGAVIFFVLRELLSDYGSWYLIVLGVFTVVLMLKAPKGIWGFVSRRWDLHFFPVQRRLEDSSREAGPLVHATLGGS